jgi:RAT1-interacting protein
MMLLRVNVFRCVYLPPTMSKRTFSDFHEGRSLGTSPHSPSSDHEPSPKRSKVDATLDYPNTSRPPGRPVPFQQPTQIISFSYTSSRTLEFTNSALRYLVDPPTGAKLGYGYERWARKPDQRGRIDGLLQAFSKARGGSASASLRDVEVVAWRGVMTRCATTIDVAKLQNADPVLG